MGNIKLNNQNGRSMIEMLGVLAIIGVLSVGGIAGYSKAMRTYRLNKAIEQITLIVGNVRTFFAPQGNYKGFSLHSDTGRNIIRKAKLLPDELLSDLDDSIYINSFYIAPLSMFSIDQANDKDFLLYATGDSENLIKQEDCISFITYDWRAVNGFVGIGVGTSSIDGTEKCENDPANLSTLEDDSTATICADKMPIDIDVAIKLCGKGTLSDGIYLRFK
ncbi:MAG: type II secretion system protein [Alphaproteobacteria bacterium]|nr:type II secretion system protein [Alphaproteobacteria bacterium]